MKFIASYFCLALIATTTTFAFAGGVGSGGGGTTTTQATPDQVADTAKKYAGMIVQSWLQKKKTDIDQEWTAEPHDVLVKLFSASNDIFQILQKTKIELRMNSACKDAAGKDSDGSIYTSKPGAICLSPFTMAPKLNQENMSVETVALVMHELSHLAGLNEDEAVQLQVQAVKEIKDADFGKIAQEITDLSSNAVDSTLGSLIVLIDKGIQDPGAMRVKDFEHFERAFENWFWVNFDFHLQYVPAHDQALLDPNFVNEGALSDFVCMNDPRISKEAREKCETEFNTGFASDNRLTARIWLARTNDVDPSVYGLAYDEVIVDKPASKSDLSAGLAKTKQYLQNILAHVVALRDFKMQTYNH